MSEQNIAPGADSSAASILAAIQSGDTKIPWRDPVTPTHHRVLDTFAEMELHWTRGTRVWKAQGPPELLLECAIPECNWEKLLRVETVHWQGLRMIARPIDQADATIAEHYEQTHPGTERRRLDLETQTPTARPGLPL